MADPAMTNRARGSADAAIVWEPTRPFVAVMRVTNLFEYLDELTRTVPTLDLPTMRAATVLWASALVTIRAGFDEEGGRMLERSFLVVQDIVGPDDARLGPFLEHFADDAQSRGMSARARALRRRAQALTLPAEPTTGVKR